MSRESKDIVVGLDIGTSKIVALVAEISSEGRLNIIGMGSQDARGLKKGVVVNIEDTVATISRVLQEVELMADCKVKDVYTGIAGSHIKSFNSNGMVAIKDKEVTPMDVERVIETARAMPIPADQEILHILTQEFIIDDQDGIREPIGMSGFRLEVKVHIVTGAVSAAQNIVKCVRRCGLEVNDLVLQPLASSYAVLSEDEKDLGICLIDIGGGTTDLAKDLAMHVAANSPQFVKPEDVSAEVVAKEREIQIDIAINSGKPKDIAEKMVEGRMKKFTGEISLTGQMFVKDPSISVADLLKKEGADVLEFVRFEVGEGIEKQETDFAAEVQAQIAAMKS